MDKDKPLRKSDIVTQNIGDEYMLYNPESGSMHVINRTAEFVLNLCDGAHSLSEIEQQLRETHRVPEGDHLRKDLEAIFQSFTDLGIIQP